MLFSEDILVSYLLRLYYCVRDTLFHHIVLVLVIIHVVFIVFKPRLHVDRPQPVLHRLPLLALPPRPTTRGSNRRADLGGSIAGYTWNKMLWNEEPKYAPSMTAWRDDLGL
jgi:hypothetical protein